VALLHPADNPSRRQYLFEHLSAILPDQGIAVLRYDRRAATPGGDVPYWVQAEDLARALEALTAAVGPVPTGLWGFGQGAWVTLLAAAGRADIAFLILVGCSAVSPARQMRYGTEQQLRRAGYGPESAADLAVLRAGWEAYQRGQLARAEAQAIVDSYASRPWFGLSWVPRALPGTPSWDDMDFDPAGYIAQLRCPVLAFYGEDEWVPVDESVAIWHREYGGQQLVIQRLPGTAHHPVFGGRQKKAAISPAYTGRLTSWLAGVIADTRR
jgi:hypothetical protein